MGEAKRRGTFEKRLEQSLKKNNGITKQTIKKLRKHIKKLPREMLPAFLKNLGEALSAMAVDEKQEKAKGETE